MTEPGGVPRPPEEAAAAEAMEVGAAETTESISMEEVETALQGLNGFTSEQLEGARSWEDLPYDHRVVDRVNAAIGQTEASDDNPTADQLRERRDEIVEMGAAVCTQFKANEMFRQMHGQGGIRDTSAYVYYPGGEAVKHANFAVGAPDTVPQLADRLREEVAGKREEYLENKVMDAAEFERMSDAAEKYIGEMERLAGKEE